MGKAERRRGRSVFVTAALASGFVLVVSACGDDESSPRPDNTGGAATGGVNGAGADTGGADSGGRTTGGRATGGELGTGGRVDAAAGTAGESPTAGGAGEGVGGAIDAGGSGGAPVECWAESAAGARGLGIGGEGGVTSDDLDSCAARGCDAVGECEVSSIGLSLCGGCTPVGVECSCECYLRFRRCGSCEDLRDCLVTCIERGC